MLKKLLIISFIILSCLSFNITADEGTPDVEFIYKKFKGALKLASKEKKILIFYLGTFRNDQNPEGISSTISQNSSHRMITGDDVIFARERVSRNGRNEITDEELIKLFKKNKINLKLNEPLLIALDPYGNLMDKVFFPIDAGKTVAAISNTKRKIKDIKFRLKKDYGKARSQNLKYLGELINIIKKTTYTGYALHNQACKDIDLLNRVIRTRTNYIIWYFNKSEKTETNKNLVLSALEDIISFYKHLPATDDVLEIIEQIEKNTTPTLRDYKNDDLNNSINTGNDPKIKAALKRKYDHAQRTLSSTLEYIEKITSLNYRGYELYEFALYKKDEYRKFFEVKEGKTEEPKSTTTSEDDDDELFQEEPYKK